MKISKTQAYDWALLTTRVLVGSVVAAHGAQKLFGWFGGYGFDGTMGYFTGDVGLPYLVGVLIILEESFGMLALALGLFARVWAAALVPVMLGAIFAEHGQHGFFMNWEGTRAGEGFEFHLLVIAGAVQIALQGAGGYSLDSYLAQRIPGRSLASTN